MLYSYLLVILLCAGSVVLLLLLAGIWLTYTGFRGRTRETLSQQWPSTGGVIEESTVRAYTTRDAAGVESTLHLPYVRYRYTVMGQTYTSDTISIGVKATQTPEAARRAADRYPVGSSVVVYYDPKNPSDSVLERVSGTDSPGLIIGITLLVLGGFSLLALTAFSLLGFAVLAAASLLNLIIG
ncbi:MAG TPA: DUF3592 domain-containing protein [Chloroflexi bacterium]|nr:DUF3592 domain-containing protein [Chloroflexota bacterium]